MVDPKRSSKFSVRGVTSITSGTRWICIANGADQAWIREAEFVDEKKAKLTLSSLGVNLIGGVAKDVVERVAEISTYPPDLVAEGPGWVGDAFALPEGTLVVGTAPHVPALAFRPDPLKCLKGGNLDSWLELAEQLRDQHLACFCLMLPFAAPLVRFSGLTTNFGFELVGPPNRGKSTLLYLMGSVVGRALGHGEGNYWVSFNATMEGLETLIPGHNDLPFIVDEAGLFFPQSTKAARAAALRGFAMRFAQGSTKLRQTGGGNTSRFVFVTSSNEPLARMLDAEPEHVRGAVTSRLMTLTVDEARPFGVFDTLPAGFENSVAFAKAIEDAMTENFGHPFAHFIEQVVKIHAVDPAEFQRSVRANMNHFRVYSGLGSKMEEARIVDAFALVYAAGKLAQRVGTLPQSYNCGRATLAVYQGHLSRAGNPPSLERALQTVLSQPGVYDLDKRGLRRIGPKLWGRIPAFSHTNRKGQVELLFAPATLDRLVPSWRQLVSDQKGRLVHRRDVDHLTQKRSVRVGKTDRVVVFVMP